MWNFNILINYHSLINYCIFTDPRFPIDGAVELHFSPGPEGRHPVPAPTPAVPFVYLDDPIVRADSPLVIEQYDIDEDYDEGMLKFFLSISSIFTGVKMKPPL